MVKKIWNILGREVGGIHNAAYLLGAFALLSQFLGLIRDRLLAHNFGAGAELDIYYAAFRIPDLIFVVGASLFSFSVLIPFLEEKKTKSIEDAKSFIDSAYTAFFFLIAGICLIAFIFMPFLTKLLFPDFSPESLEKVISLSRLLLLSPIFLGFSNLIASVTQLEKRFVLYAITPLIYNAVTIFGILFLLPYLGIMGVAFGVVLGSVFHALIQVPFVKKTGLLPDIIFPFPKDDILRIVKHSLPRTLALSGGNIALIALISLASTMKEGSISVLTFAMNLQGVPLAIIGTSYSMAAFPLLSSLFASGNKNEFEKIISTTLRHIIFYALPIAALFIVLRAQIVRTVLGSGAFTWSDTRLTAACLAILAVSVAFQCVSILFMRAYYASGRTKLPFFVTLATVPLTILLPYVLVWVFRVFPNFEYFLSIILKIDDVVGREVIAIPLGYSIGMLVQALMFWYFANKDFSSLKKNVFNTAWQSLLSAFVTGVASYVALNILDKLFDIDTLFGIFAQGFFAGIFGIIFGIGSFYITKSVELRDTFKSLKINYFKKSVPILPEQTDM